MSRRPDIAEVAKHARVSKSTVSRVINGGYASADVRARVAKVIQKVGYTPWVTAQNFALGRAGSFGLVVEDTQNEWILQLLGGVEEELTSKHLSLLVGSLVLRGTYDAATVASWIREHRVDGLIFARPGRRERALIESARKIKLAIALVAPDDAFKAGATLRSNNIDAGREIAEHLYELGHRRIAYLGGPEDSLDSRQRARGLEEGLALRRLKIAAQLLIFAARYHLDEGVAFAQHWLKMPRPRAPTAVVCASDNMALGFMRTLQISGVSVPRDVSVVGYDDVPAASLFVPALTTARPRLRAMGAAACRSLIAQLNGEPQERLVVDFPMDLVVRQSTGPSPDRKA